MVCSFVRRALSAIPHGCDEAEVLGIERLDFRPLSRRNGKGFLHCLVSPRQRILPTLGNEMLQLLIVRTKQEYPTDDQAPSVVADKMILRTADELDFGELATMLFQIGEVGIETVDVSEPLLPARMQANLAAAAGTA
jgi:hypothetical protein